MFPASQEPVIAQEGGGRWKTLHPIQAIEISDEYVIPGPARAALGYVVPDSELVAKETTGGPPISLP